MEQLIDQASLIITLDVDAAIFETLERLVSADFSVVELNQVKPEMLAKLLKSFPSLRIGVGNVLNTEQLEQAHANGAHFASSLGYMPALVQTATVYGFHYLPGVATFSEAMQAHALGCQHVRPFPATLAFCHHLNKYLPGLRLFPAELKCEQEAIDLLQLPSVAAASLINPDLDMLKALQLPSMAAS